MLRRYSDTVAVATVDLDVFQPGWYLVESANSDEFLEFTAASVELFLAKDGRAFPIDRAHYIVGIVQLLMSKEEDQPKPVAELDQIDGQKEKGGESGYDPDQEE